MRRPATDAASPRAYGDGGNTNGRRGRPRQWDAHGRTGRYLYAQPDANTQRHADKYSRTDPSADTQPHAAA
jgi:hypothetical protein